MVKSGIFNGISIVLFVMALILTSCQTVKNVAETQASRVAPKGSLEKIEKVGSGLSDIYNSFRDVSIEAERDIGEGVALQAYASGLGNPIQDDDLMEFMTCLANAIAQNSERPMLTYHVAVINSDKFSAFSTPGGYIFITSGMIKEIETESELACVIGHEIAHIARKHALCSMQRAQRLKGFSKISSSALDGNLAGFNELIENMCKEVVVHKFDLDVEIESDLLGIRYAMDTGYDPRTFITFLEKLKKFDSEGRTGGSHPKTDDRIVKVQEELSKMLDQLGKQEQPETMESLTRDTGRMKLVKEWIARSKDQPWK